MLRLISRTVRPGFSGAVRATTGRMQLLRPATRALATTIVDPADELFEHGDLKEDVFNALYDRDQAALSDRAKKNPNASAADPPIHIFGKSGRYAMDLYRVAYERGTLFRVYTDAKNFANLVSDNPDAASLVANEGRLAPEVWFDRIHRLIAGETVEEEGDAFDAGLPADMSPAEYERKRAQHAAALNAEHAKEHKTTAAAPEDDSARAEAATAATEEEEYEDEDQDLDELDQELGGDVESEFARLLMTVAEKGDYKHLPQVLIDFDKLVLAKLGIVEAVVTSAGDLPTEAITDLHSVLQNNYTDESQKIRIISETDGSIGGGLTVSIGDTFLDYSSATRMSFLENKLREVTFEGTSQK